LGIVSFGIVIVGRGMLGQLAGMNPSSSLSVSALATAGCTPSVEFGIEALRI
jgi:hypothetical protein